MSAGGGEPIPAAEAPSAREQGGAMVGQVAGAAAVQVWLALLGLVTTPFLLERLGPAAYGVFAMVGAVAGHLSNLELGFGQATIRYLARARAAGDGAAQRAIVETSAAVFAGAALLSLALLAAAAGWLVRSFFHVPPALATPALDAFRIGALMLGLSFLAGFFASVLQALQRVGWLSATRAVAGTAAAVAALAAVALGAGLRGVFAAQAAVAVLGALLLGLGAWRAGAPLRPRLHRAQLAEMGRYGVVVFAAGIAYQWMINGPPLVLGALVAAAEIPAFSVPHTVLQKLALLVGSASLAFLPFASAAAAGPGGALAGAFRAHVRLTLLAMGPLAAVLAVFAQPLLGAWVDPTFAAAAAPCLRVLALAAVVLALSGPPADVARAAGRPLWVLVYTAVVAAAGLVACLLLIPRWRALGAAFAFLAALLIGTLPLLFAVPRALLSLPPPALLRAMAGPLLAVSALAAALAALEASGAGWSGRIAGLALGGAAYAVLAWKVVLSESERQALRHALRRAP